MIIDLSRIEIGRKHAGLIDSTLRDSLQIE